MGNQGEQAFQDISGEVLYKGRRYHLRDGKITGEEIRFTMGGEPFGKSAPVEFSGHIRGHAIEGTMDDGTTRRVWKATRNPSTVQPIAR